MKKGSDLLWLSEKDVGKILAMKKVLPVIEKAFQQFGRGEVQMPPKVYLEFSPYGGDLRAMPGYIKGVPSSAGVKIVNSNPDNPKKGLPAVTGVMVYIDPPTGLPLGIFAAGKLTQLRTGAAGGIAAKYLAKPSSSIVGLVGCGRQAWTQLEALDEVFRLKKVLVWGVTKKEASNFCQRAKKHFKMEFIVSGNVQQACRADIIVATTPVRIPVIKAEWIAPGTHINAIGADAPGKQELDPALLYKSRVIVDSWEQASHAGEINLEVTAGRFTKKHLTGELGRVVLNKIPGRVSSQDITIFDSTGLALQDVAVAAYLYTQAGKLKKGKVLKFNG